MSCDVPVGGNVPRVILSLMGARDAPVLGAALEPRPMTFFQAESQTPFTHEPQRLPPPAPDDEVFRSSVSDKYREWPYDIFPNFV